MIKMEIKNHLDFTAAILKTKNNHEADMPQRNIHRLQVYCDNLFLRNYIFLFEYGSFLCKALYLSSLTGGWANPRFLKILGYGEKIQFLALNEQLFTSLSGSYQSHQPQKEWS